MVIDSFIIATRECCWIMNDRENTTFSAFLDERVGNCFDFSMFNRRL
jgi:hypothetical protein